MLGAIYIGLSGMTAYSKGLQTISNNVANLNTAGYKATSTSFSDVFNSGGVGSSYIGSNAGQLGNGVKYADPTVDFGQGDLRATDGDLDLALQGSGLLVLLDGDKTYFTRTGHFVVDEEGFIVEQGSGYKLAVLDQSNQPVPLNIDSRQTRSPVATANVKFNSNLTSDLGSLPDGKVSVSNVTVYDSNGGKHVWTVTLTPVEGSAGHWTVKVTDANGDVGEAGTIQFDAFGKPVEGEVDVVIASGDWSVTLDFAGATNHNTGSASGLQTSDIDGSPMGTLVGATIDTDGQVKLTYSNEESENLGYVAIADFRDPQALDRVGSGMFENARNGEYRLLASGTYGIGKLVAGQMEASNVDLSEQFGDLILIQRGFQASSQVVSVSNDMIQQLFGIRGQG